MIQQANLKLKCLVDNHKEEIEFICYQEFCKGFGLNCFDCFKKGTHHTHSDDVKKVNSLIQFIESKNKECDNFIDDLYKQIENLYLSFSQLTKGIRNKYSLVQERLVYMNSHQINDYLNSTIKLTEYKQSISTILQEQIKKLKYSFNNLYEQLKLSSFNYYQIDEILFNQLKIYAKKVYNYIKMINLMRLQNNQKSQFY